MFVRQRQLFETNLTRIAERLGLDMAAFERCMNEHQTLPLILEDCRAGQRLELRSTPTLFINGREVVGSISEPCGYDHAISIERELASAKSSPVR
jgi:predicted DsbA family dithiol-disulfide isomerase